ncbi:FkbM family methyltransferase [Parafrankia sp. FMc2]|uniref:FkbM family methyltransferase n=1 Tax=Parafrankia sp. FMc2 TaxID=3233196 RepID=UPI0034D6C109
MEDCQDGSLRDLVALSYRSPALAPVFAAVLRPGDCCYDVGANIGVYTLWAAGLVHDVGEVHAFEPVPRTMAVLRALVGQNRLQNVRPSPVAVGSAVGNVGLQTTRNASGLAHVVDDAVPDVTTAMTTLDTYSTENRVPALIKIDVEGFELDVLRGAEELLRTSRPAILLEVVPSHLARRGTNSKELVGFLRELNYTIYNLTPRGLKPAYGTVYTTNVLALSPEWDRLDYIVAELTRAIFPRNQIT